MIDAGGDFRRFVTAVSGAAGDWRSVGGGLLTVLLVLEREGLTVVEERSRSLRKACWRCSRKDIMPPMVIGARSASLAVDKSFVRLCICENGRLKGMQWAPRLTSSLDVVYDVCDGRSIAIRKGLSTGELGMFKEG